MGDERTQYIQQRIEQALDGWSFSPQVDVVLSAPKSKMVRVSPPHVFPVSFSLFSTGARHPVICQHLTTVLVLHHQILEDFYKGSGINKIILFCQVFPLRNLPFHNMCAKSWASALILILTSQIACFLVRTTLSPLLPQTFFVHAFFLARSIAHTDRTRPIVLDACIVSGQSTDDSMQSIMSCAAFEN
jgi:hypothetical protein